MSNNFETTFIEDVVEKTPFVSTPAQEFFSEWCKINDSIVPQFIERKEWEQRGVQGILEKNYQGKQTLFLPKDLHLWEMVDVIKTVDHDTLARNPEKRGERAEKIHDLGIIFEKAGLYLHEYLPYLNEDCGKTIAQDIAQKFYQYGLSLQNKKQITGSIPQESTLSKEDKIMLDEWFLGGEMYQKRLSRLNKNPTEEEREELRKKYLSVYFKALSREGYKAEGEKPWETEIGPTRHLQERTRTQITKAIETPERELKTAIYRRGVEKLVTEMKTPNWRISIQNFLQEGYNLDLATEQVKLYTSLEIPRLKQELEELRKTGDVVKISAKELKIAQSIHKAVCSFQYKERQDGDGSPNHPSKMVETQFINCVGSSILGGSLLDELQINYLHAHLPEHSATVLVTSDGKMYWQDFTPSLGSNVDYVEIKPHMLEGEMDIPSMSSFPDNGLTMLFKDSELKGKQLRVNLFKPEIGLQLHILNNTGAYLDVLGRSKEAAEAFLQAISLNPNFFCACNGLGIALNNLGRYEEAAEVYRQAISLDPKEAYPYSGLGNALLGLGRDEEAIEAYRQAISVDPKYANPYNGLGNALNNLIRNEEAIEAYRQAISVDPKHANPYNGIGNALLVLGRNEEAIEAYRQAISVDPKYAGPYNGLGNALKNLGRNEEAVKAYEEFIKVWEGDYFWTRRAQNIIKELNEKLNKKGFWGFRR